MGSPKTSILNPFHMRDREDQLAKVYESYETVGTGIVNNI